ncbi:MAG: hypothetical protein AAF441_06680 [Pseudomonadota bacterium]
MKQSALLKAILFSLWLISGPAAAQDAGPFHPMDALTPEEIQLGVSLLKNSNLADDRTHFADIRLREIPKADMLEWRRGKSFPRLAFFSFRKDRKVMEALVDLKAQKVLGTREVAGAQPAIYQSEWNRAREAVLKNPDWLARMAAMGYEDPKSLNCTPIGAGSISDAQFGARRILKVTCFDIENRLDYLQARPLDHIVTAVDADTGEVLKVLEAKAPSVPREIKGYNNGLAPRRKPLNPVVNIAPSGANFVLRGGIEVEWQNWTFHMRTDRRSGLILSLVNFMDQGNKRLIAYQMALSEMYVPYMDPSETWAFKTFLDAGEYGLGYLISTLAPGRDCPHNAVFIDALIPSDLGGVFRADKAVCVFERNTGDPAWRHYQSGAQRNYSAPQVELVVRMAPTIGNYDYIVDYVFQLRGTIKVRVGASGLDALKMVSSARADSPTAREDLKYGNLVAPYTVAPYHDHYFSFRLDMDVDGPRNMMLLDTIQPQALPKDSARRSLWTIRTSQIVKEGAVPHGHGRKRIHWRVINPNKRTPLGHFPGYKLVPGHVVTSLLSPDDPPQRRALFSSNPLWVTRQKAGEYWAAGDYPNQSKGGDGLPKYVSDAETVSNQDLVLWYTMGFHHVTLPEDFPVLPTMWHEFTLRPANFFTQNPAHDLSPSFVVRKRTPGQAKTSQ